MNKTIILVLTVLLSQIIMGQEIIESSVIFNHIALSVNDADRSAGFYKKTLNLKEITNKTEVEGIRWLSLGEGKELHLISLPDDEIKTNKAVHFAVSTADFGSFIKNLKSMNVVYSDWTAETPYEINIRTDGIKQVFFQDPDGYWIEVNSVGTKN